MAGESTFFVLLSSLWSKDNCYKNVSLLMWPSSSLITFKIITFSSAFCKSFNWWEGKVRFWLNTDESRQDYLVSLCSCVSWSWYKNILCVLAGFSPNLARCTLGELYLCIFKQTGISKNGLMYLCSEKLYFVMNLKIFSAFFSSSLLMKLIYAKSLETFSHIIKIRRSWKTCHMMTRK